MSRCEGRCRGGREGVEQKRKGLQGFTLVRMEDVEARGEDVEAETHGMLVFQRFTTFYKDLIVRGLPTATPRFPKGFQGFRVGDLDIFKTEQEFPMFLIVRAPPAEPSQNRRGAQHLAG